MVKQAGVDAKKDIDEDRAAREAALLAPNAEATAMTSKITSLTAETTAKIALLDGEYAQTKDAVVGMLLQVVLNIDNPFAAKQ